MNKILTSIKAKPVNLILIILVPCLYLLNNLYLKNHTGGVLQYFMICHFNDLICPLFFIAYSNLLLLTVGRELRKLHWVLLFGICAGLIWEFFAPVIKPSATTDWIDLVFYTLGTALYWCILKAFPGRRSADDKS